MTITATDLVRREVFYCASSIVGTLAKAAFSIEGGRGLGDGRSLKDVADLAEQAFELCSPVADYEEAAIQAGWEDVTDTDKFPPCSQFRDKNDGQTWACNGWQALCEEFDIEPYDREIYEHWIVSDWLAEKLAEKGEKVDTDFSGMTIWARTTTGQAIEADSVIQQITAELNAA